MDDAIIEKVLAISDGENGGDNALDGFEFQVSCAIYLMFKELNNNNDFALIYEKLEDFIIFTDKIHLYQAKSISTNLTPNVLYKRKKATKILNVEEDIDETTLSIIEKMHNNYSIVVKNVPSKYIVDNNLLLCESISFSSKLSNIKGIKDLWELNFSSLKADAKDEIIKNTNCSSYKWDRINAIRLIPKSRHEEVTRIYIEDVIKNILGSNKINSLALYNSLTCEIRKIRKQKTKLTNNFILNEINNFATFDKDIKYSDCIHFLSEKDKRNLDIQRCFNSIQNFIKIEHHPNFNDFIRIKDLYRKYHFKDIDEIYQAIISNDDFKDMYIRLNEYELKALILIMIVKELN